jgi:endogenous inhibitor of DNA gyrase (YacG/DUF329 family)
MLLRCEECGKQAQTEEEARRWRAYLIVIAEEEPEEVIVSCPDCAKRASSRPTMADLCGFRP